jgi:transposase
MAIVDRHGLPVAVSIASASPHETQLVETTLEQRFLPETPERMIGDRAYDSEPLDDHVLNHYATEMIAPHRPGRRNPPTQDGRPLRRYRLRWKVERFFAWLHNSRRLVTRWEYPAENFLAMLQLACALILLRHR